MIYANDYSEDLVVEAMACIDAAWDEMRRNPWVKRNIGEVIDRLPDISEAAVRARSERAMELLARIAAVDASRLPDDARMSLGVARLYADRWSQEIHWYWLVFDPLGIGFFAMFAPTAYCGGWLLDTVGGILSQYIFTGPGDVWRYLGLVEDYARLVDQLRERTAGQAARGIRIPRPQIAPSLALVRGLRDAVGAGLLPKAERLCAVDAEDTQARIDTAIKSSVIPAMEALVALIEDPDYVAAAPETVGLAQYPGGREIYDALVTLHTTLETTPEAVHAEGLQRVTAIRKRLDTLLRETGCADAQALVQKINADPAWRATSEELGAVFDLYIKRLAPHLDHYFDFKAKAPYEAAPLPDALAGSMTFGYYSQPGPGNPVGRYLYNARNLATNHTAPIAALNYHELVPGHHFHVASQGENRALHPLRANAFINAFNEGWAEYAATLAGEIGMYEAPEERFGRLMMDAFLTSRLVVDTGMNALGWTLEQARDYMRANALLPEAEIDSETLRYSCDMPGQALAYKLGETFLMEQREAMQERLGERYDIRAFHNLVLRPGCLPLPIVADNITRALADS